MSFFDYSMQDNAIRIIREGANRKIPVPAFLSHEIQKRKSSPEYKWMLIGENYYAGRHDVLRKTRQAIGSDGKPVQLDNLPNSKHIDNVYKRMVKQKTNYLVGKPFTVNADDKKYQDLLMKFFDKVFFAKMKNITKDALNCGIAWLYVHYDETGNLVFDRFRPYECIPEWEDIDHTRLNSLIRFYDVISYNGMSDEKITLVEYYTKEGIDYFEYYNGSLVGMPPFHEDYMQIGGMTANWDGLPLIPFKYDEELPLIANCKSLQDGLNSILSVFDDNMHEDSRNTILILVNYDGENLGEFRQNLATYGAVKVRSSEGGNGDLRSLQVEVNSENYKAIIEIFKRAIIENCMGYDVKNEKMSGTPNQMNIESMYNDIDIDASDMETEFQQSLDRLLYFIDLHLANTGQGDYSNVDVDITFNTDMPMDEANTIANMRNSDGLISQRTLVAHHPWVMDPEDEIEQLKKEKQEALEEYNGAFSSNKDEEDE